MRHVQRAMTPLIIAIAVMAFTGCTVAEAASPKSKNTPRASTEDLTPTPTPTPPPEIVTPSAQPEPEPMPTNDAAGAYSWREVDGTWCSSTDCLTVTNSNYTNEAGLWLLQMTSAEQHCFQGTLENVNYPGSLMMYCPAGVATPFALIHPSATSADEAVMNDDASRDRMWFYQGMGADTYFRQS